MRATRAKTVPCPSRRLRIVPLALLLAAALLAGCDDDGGGSGLSGSRPAAAHDADVAVAWFDELYGLVKANGTNPPRASRQYGYTGVALYEAVVAGMPGHRSLVGQLNDLAALPEPEDARHHWPIVANAALARIVGGFHPGNLPQIDALEAEILARENDGVASAVADRSVTFGRALGGAVLAWAQNDGIAELSACSDRFTPPRAPVDGGWTPSGPGPANGLEPCWGNLRPLVLVDAGDCAAQGPPSYSTRTDSAFYAHALAVYNTTGDGGAALSEDEVTIARYWADDAGRTGTPPGHWVALVGSLLERDGLALDVAAEAYARVGMAVADSFIVCWQTKYEHYLLRPISYIRANIDPGWDPLLATPPFATYTSGHSTQSGAAAAVLTDYFGPIPFTDATHERLNPELGLGTRAFRDFLQAGSEAAVSRLYGGIHFIFDNEDGYDQGLCIGAVHNARLQFVR